MVAPLKFNATRAKGPLALSPAQRHEFLSRHAMEMGWLLLTRSEMNAMRQAMEECQSENTRLNQEQARMMAERVTPSETKDALDTAQAHLVKASDDLALWRQWTRFCLGDILEADSTKALQDKVVAAFDKLVLENAALKRQLSQP